MHRAIDAFEARPLEGIKILKSGMPWLRDDPGGQGGSAAVGLCLQEGMGRRSLR